MWTFEDLGARRLLHGCIPKKWIRRKLRLDQLSPGWNCLHALSLVFLFLAVLYLGLFQILLLPNYGGIDSQIYHFLWLIGQKWWTWFLTRVQLLDVLVGLHLLRGGPKHHLRLISEVHDLLSMVDFLHFSRSGVHVLLLFAIIWVLLEILATLLLILHIMCLLWRVSASFHIK